MSDFILPSSLEDRIALRVAVQQCVDLKVIASAAADTYKEEIKAVAEKFDIPAKEITRQVNVKYKQNFSEVAQSNQLFEELYEVLNTPVSSDQDEPDEESEESEESDDQ